MLYIKNIQIHLLVWLLLLGGMSETFAQFPTSTLHQLPAGKRLVISYKATVGDNVPAATTELCEQGEITYDNPNTNATDRLSALSDDPSLDGITDPNCVSVETCDITASICPPDITVNTDTGFCDALVTIPDPTIPDNCGNATFSYSPVSGDIFPIGTTEVTATISDGAGAQTTCTLNVTVTTNDPLCEDGIDEITDVLVVFLSDSAEVVATAKDPDGDGPMGLQVIDDIQLEENTDYFLTILLLKIVGEDTIDVTDQIYEGFGNDYLTFFGWTEGIFVDPGGDGNIDNRNDLVNYSDFDVNFLPIGLLSTWTTGDALSGTFRIVLKNQMGIKSDVSTVDDGETEFDLIFNVGSATSLTSYIDSKQAFNLWPNPSSGKFQWEIQKATEPIDELVIFDKLGRMVKKIEQPSTSLDLSALPEGTYSVFANSKNKRWVQRLIITK